ncbi:MAG TPA: hypothetical protein DDY04_06080 [Bacteroidales bacterium]|nr:hypothetical protein [Bacteroidales bacterium]
MLKIKELAIQSSTCCLNAILLTTITDIFTLIPMAIKRYQSLYPIQTYRAKVIMGGLLTSTFLNIYINHVVYTLFIKNETFSNNGNQD